MVSVSISTFPIDQTLTLAMQLDVERQYYGTNISSTASGHTAVTNLYCSSTIIEAVKDFCLADTNRKWAYFYFDFNDINKQNVAILLRSLIRQLCAREPELLQVVHTLYTQYEPSGQQPSIKELSSTFFLIVDGFGREIYVIMDALDEYPESKRKELLDQIKQMIEHGSKNLHILVTSRSEYDIRNTLEKPAAGGIPIQNPEVDGDIKLHVRNCLAEDPAFEKLPGGIKEDIEMKLGEEAHGMWATFSHVQIDAEY